ncbi:MAG TPA: hypothetical protein VGF92_02855 [Stellaceae bacterium]|jgi:hypothetical protein
MTVLDIFRACFCRRAYLWEQWAAATPLQRFLAIHIAITTRSARHG